MEFDWLKIRSRCGILIYSAWQGLTYQTCSLKSLSSHSNGAKDMHPLTEGTAIIGFSQKGSYLA